MYITYATTFCMFCAITMYFVTFAICNCIFCNLSPFLSYYKGCTTILPHVPCKLPPHATTEFSARRTLQCEEVWATSALAQVTVLHYWIPRPTAPTCTNWKRKERWNLPIQFWCPITTLLGLMGFGEGCGEWHFCLQWYFFSSGETEIGWWSWFRFGIKILELVLDSDLLLG